MRIIEDMWVIIVAVAILFFVIWGRNLWVPPVRINVAAGTKDQLVISIENPTPHIVLFGDPRFNRSTARFDWELLSGQHVIRTSAQTQIDRDPLSFCHPSGPVDI